MPPTRPADPPRADSRRGSTHAPSERRTQHRDFGGFPLPHVLAGRVLARLFPRAKHALVRSVTIEHAPGLGARYLSFDAVVGANSAFPLLSNEQLEELGGVEYRALNALLWIVAGVSPAAVDAFVRVADVAAVPHRVAADLLHHHRAVHVARQVEGGLYPTCAAPRRRARLVGLLLFACASLRELSMRQVWALPGRLGLHKYGHVARRPVDDAVPRRVWSHLSHHLPRSRW
jgi:hypothetical protein